MEALKRAAADAMPGGLSGHLQPQTKFPVKLSPKTGKASTQLQALQVFTNSERLSHGGKGP
jgi:hypothetical protein